VNAGVIGFTSWSRTLTETVRHLQPLRQTNTKYVVEMVGDLGPPTQQHLAAQNTQQLANLTGAEPVFLRLPGVLHTLDIKQTLLDHDRHARATLTKLNELDFALTGIGAVGIGPPLRAGDKFFTARQVARAKKLGAVGELNLRYLAEDGEPVNADIEDLVIGVTLEQLRRADPRLGVAGGPSKYRAIRAALVGGWLNALVTDFNTAHWLLRIEIDGGPQPHPYPHRRRRPAAHPPDHGRKPAGTTSPPTGHPAGRDQPTWRRQ